VGLQFLNIKAWMLALTLTAGWVVNAGGQPAANPGERLAIICVVMVFFAFVSNFTYAVAGSLLRQWLSQGRRLVWFNRVLAAVLVATALWMLTV
jgi:threonine/homoserine/homoserine lactone efflux protein